MFVDLFRNAEVAVSSLSSLVLPRNRSRPSNKPSLNRRAKRRLLQVREFATLRTRFAAQWVNRGLGFVQPRTLNPALLDQGLTLVLPGIESESVFTYGMCDGLADGGVPGQIRVFNWGLPFPGGYLANLTRIDRNRRRAIDIAHEITKYQDAFPDRPVHVVAQSGGAGLAIFAAEALPQNRQIDGIVLLGGALSPTYNLAKAMRKTRKGILNSYSSKDALVLRWGTRLFGTIDRQFTPACGCVGFSIPDSLTDDERRLYDQKLHQLPWCLDMIDCHHLGGHLSSGSQAFLARKIAPWLRD
jgi:pimeloyl-ACP methyl ester carboxylesterase